MSESEQPNKTKSPASADSQGSIESFSVSLESTVDHDKDRQPTAKSALSTNNGLAGRFRLEQKLGRGGFGEVWRAYDAQRGCHVAVKGPRSDASITPSLIEQFLREAEKVQQLDDSGVVPVLDVVREPTDDEGKLVCFIVMKLMSGSLGDRIKQGRLPTELAAVRWIQSLAESLGKIHEKGLVHRDIKPDNILFDDERPCFSDFGLAATVGELLDEERRLYGTVHYMSPEQARGERVDRQTDIYSLGVVLYQLLAIAYVDDRRHAMPFLAKDAEEYLACLADPNQHARPLPEGVPADLAEIVEKRCLNADKSQRFRSASELGLALKSWVAEQSAPKRRYAVVSVGALACLLLGVVAWFAWPAEWDAIPETPQQAAPAPVAATERELPPNRWNKLLDAPLEPMLWDRAKSTLIEDRELEQATIIANGMAMLGAGRVDAAPSWKLRCTLAQPDWNGKAGVFYGLRLREDGQFDCCRIQLKRSVDRLARPTYRLVREDLVLDESFLPRSTIGRASAEISQPAEEAEIQLEFRGAELKRVTWNGQAISDLLKNSRPSKPQLLCDGAFGVYVEKGTTIVSRWRAFIEEGRIDDERPEEGPRSERNRISGGRDRRLPGQGRWNHLRRGRS